MTPTERYSFFFSNELIAEEVLFNNNNNNNNNNNCKKKSKPMYKRRRSKLNLCWNLQLKLYNNITKISSQTKLQENCEFTF